MPTPAQKQAAREDAIRRARTDVEQGRSHSSGQALMEFAEHSTDPIVAELARRTLERQEEE